MEAPAQRLQNIKTCDSTLLNNVMMALLASRMRRYGHTFPHDVIGVVGDYPNDMFYGTTRLAIAFIWLC